jgi:hypothetical protein
MEKGYQEIFQELWCFLRLLLEICYKNATPAISRGLRYLDEEARPRVVGLALVVVWVKGGHGVLVAAKACDLGVNPTDQAFN